MSKEDEINLSDNDLNEGTLIIGKEKSGKTDTIIKPLLLHLLKEKSNGENMSITVIDSGGEINDFVQKVTEKLNLSYRKLDITNDNESYNLIEGDTEAVILRLNNILKHHFNEQDRFFATIHEVIIKHTVSILKGLHENNINIFDILSVLKNKKLFKEKIEMYKVMFGKNESIHFLEDELFGTMQGKYDQFTFNIIAMLEELENNDTVKNIFGKQTTIDLASHITNGGLLTIETNNTFSGKVLGTSVLMELQKLLLTTENNIPHYIIIDKAHYYINSDTDVFLDLSRKYNISNIYAINNLSNIDIEMLNCRSHEMKRAVLSNMKNKIIFVEGLSDEDAIELIPLLDYGKVTIKEKKLFRTKEKEHYLDINNIHFHPKFTFIHHLMKNGEMEKVGIGLGRSVPEKWNWREK